MQAGIWRESLGILKGRVGREHFETWIEPIHFLSAEGDAVRLQVPNKFYKDWLVERYSSLFEEAIEKASQKRYQVDFVVDPRAAEKLGDDNIAPIRAEKAARTHAPPPPDLNEEYTFRNFVVGGCNKLAHAAAMAVSRRPAKIYNPLFVFGASGLGKTHLLHAVGHQALEQSANLRVVVITAERFTNELIHSIRFDKMAQFREKYRSSCDVLLMDDIQFIAGKESTQEAFFHVFNALHLARKQIVVTSDRYPQEIPDLDDRLRTRFEWGLVADIQPPSLETRVAIIKTKASRRTMEMPDDVAVYLASNLITNIRALEGALVRIEATASITGRAVDLALAEEVLRHVVVEEEGEGFDAESIIEATASYFGVRAAEIKGKKRLKEIAYARQVAMYLTRKLTGLSFPDIGKKFGGKDHSTVMYACKKMQDLLHEDSRTKAAVEKLTRRFDRFTP